MSNQQNTKQAATDARGIYPPRLPADQQFLLGVPCYGAMMTQPFAMSLIDLLSKSPFIGSLEFVLNDSLIPRARNTIAARFLGSPYQWLLFLDNDLQFRHEHIARLWLHGVKQGRKVVCGLCAFKQLTPTWVANWLPDEKPDENGAVRVAAGGTGCMLIHRSVLETMRDKMPEIAFINDANNPDANTTQWDFFAVGPYRFPNGMVRYLSEDWMFCQRARDLGIDIWADTQIQIKHMGNMVFPPEVPDLVEAITSIRKRGHPALPKELI